MMESRSIQRRKATQRGESAPQFRRIEIALSFDIIIEPDEDEFHVFCPALKGLHVGGSTEEEAIQNAVDGATIYVESVIAQGVTPQGESK